MSVSDRERRYLYEAVAEAWNDAQIRYVVMHGIERYPYYFGRDLDVLVAKDELNRALTIAAEIASRKGYLVVWPHHVWGKRIIAFRRVGLVDVSVEIHMLPRLQWRGCVLVQEPSPRVEVGPFLVDPWASWAKSVLMYILTGNIGKACWEHKNFLQNKQWIPTILSMLQSHLGNSVARQLWYSLLKPDLEALKDMRGRVRRVLLVRGMLRQPASVFAGHFYSIFRRLFAILRPSAPVVAVVGPDGSGKTTVLARCFSDETSIFTRMVIRHLRPGLLPPLAALVRRRPLNVNQGRPIPPRRTPGRGDFLRVVYYGLDYILGYWLLDRVETGKQRLVLYDRHALDMVVDPVRYGLRSTRWAWFMVRMIPRPDLIVALVADPKVIVRRKTELSEKEIAVQNATWVELNRQGYVDVVLDSSRPVEEVVGELRWLILQQLIQKSKFGQ